MAKSNRIEEEYLPERPETREKICSLKGCLEISIYKTIIKNNGNENIFSFLCGIVANLPISAVFNLLAMKVDWACGKEITIFCLNLAFVVLSLILTYFLIKFTVVFISIIKVADREDNNISRKNVRAEEIYAKIGKLKSFIIFSIVFAVLCVADFAGVFIVNNFI
ncbi:MAG: hypothetical protein HDQ88_09965 [Clostridia bacterium]|nr:hypothetical protein [Clostridia bacterium]